MLASAVWRRLGIPLLIPINPGSIDRRDLSHDVRCRIAPRWRDEDGGTAAVANLSARTRGLGNPAGPFGYRRVGGPAGRRARMAAPSNEYRCSRPVLAAHARRKLDWNGTGEGTHSRRA